MESRRRRNLQTTVRWLLYALLALLCAAARTLALLARGRRQRALDGKIGFSVFPADDHDLHVLTLGQMLANVVDVGVGDF